MTLVRMERWDIGDIEAEWQLCRCMNGAEEKSGHLSWSMSVENNSTFHKLSCVPELDPMCIQMLRSNLTR